MSENELLKLLAPEPTDPVFPESLARTLQVVRERRRRRNRIRASALVVVSLALILFVNQQRQDGRRPSREEALDLAMAAEIVSTTALSQGEMIETRSDNVVTFETRPQELIEQIGDEELLSQAPGCIAITRLNGRASVMLLCDELFSP